MPVSFEKRATDLRESVRRAIKESERILSGEAPNYGEQHSSDKLRFCEGCNRGYCRGNEGLRSPWACPIFRGDLGYTTLL